MEKDYCHAAARLQLSFNGLLSFFNRNSSIFQEYQGKIRYNDTHVSLILKELKLKLQEFE